MVHPVQAWAAWVRPNLPRLSLSFNINPQLKHMHAVRHQQLHFQMAGFVNLQDVNLSPFKLLGRVKRGLGYSIPGRIFPFVRNE